MYYEGALPGGPNGDIRRDRDGTETLIWTGDSLGLFPITCRSIFIQALDLQIVRVTDGETFTVFDRGRPCPVAGSAAQLETCANDGLVPAPFPGFDFDPAGIDLERGAALFAYESEVGEVLVAIDATRAVVVLRTAALDPVRRLKHVVVEPGGRRYVFLVHDVWDHPRMVTLSGAWSPLPIPTPIMKANGDKQPAPFHGSIAGTSMTRITYVLDPPSGADPTCPACCACAAGFMVCQPCAGIEPPKVSTVDLGAFSMWVPVPEGAQPGETIFYGRTKSDYVLETWRLLRSTAARAVVPLIDGPTFVDLVDDPGVRAALGELGEVREIQPDSTGHKLCLLDDIDHIPDDDTRVWELTLDAAGQPASVHLVATGAYRGCAYSDAGERALLTATGALTLGDRELRPLTGVAMRNLVRAGGRFLALQVDGQALCIQDDGMVSGSAGEVSALAPGPGDSVFYVTLSGRGEVATVDGFCSRTGPRLALHEEDTMYDAAELEYRFTQYPVRTEGDHLAVRPDGIVLYQPVTAVRMAGPTTGLLPPPTPLFRLRPTFEPVAAGDRVAGLERFRRDRELGNIHSFEYGFTGGIATLPGGDVEAFAAADGWATFGPQPSPPAGAGADAGVGDAGSDAGAGENGAGSGCGCRTGRSARPSAGALLGLGLVFARRCRRGRSALRCDSTTATCGVRGP